MHGGDGQPALARELRGARFALWKNPEHLTVRQRGKLARVAEVNQHLYKAYLSPDALIGLAMLALGGLCPPLPGGA
jgi:transposase